MAGFPHERSVPGYSGGGRAGFAPASLHRSVPPPYSASLARSSSRHERAPLVRPSDLTDSALRLLFRIFVRSGWEPDSRRNPRDGCQMCVFSCRSTSQAYLQVRWRRATGEKRTDGREARPVAPMPSVACATVPDSRRRAADDVVSSSRRGNEEDGPVPPQPGGHARLAADLIVARRRSRARLRLPPRALISAPSRACGWYRGRRPDLCYRGLQPNRGFRTDL